MNPVVVKSAYARALMTSGPGVGDSVMIITPGGDVGPIRARLVGFMADDVVTDVQQGVRKVILLVDDVAAVGLAPFVRTYDIRWGSKVLSTRSVDDSSRSVQGVLIAYEIEVAGA